MHNLVGEEKCDRWQLQAPLALVLLAVVLVCTGYTMPSGNHAVQIPPILSILDPDLYIDDFHVQEMSRFSVRTYFIWMISGLASTGLGIQWAFFLTYLIALGGYLAASYLVGRAVGGGRVVGTLFMILAVLPLRMTLGMVWPFMPTPVPQTFAMPLALTGLAMCLSRRWVAGYALFGIACLFQFLVGGLIAGVLLPLMMVETYRRRRFKESLLALGVMGLFVGAVYIPMAVAGTVSSGVLTGAEFVELYARIRAPHHVLVSSWPRHEFAQFGAYFIGVSICLVLSRAVDGWAKAVISTVLGGSVVALVIGYMLVEIYPVSLVAKLQLARLTPFCQLLGLAVVAAHIVWCWRNQQRVIGVAILLTPLVEYGGIILGLLSVMSWCTGRDSRWVDRVRLSVVWRWLVLPAVLAVVACGVMYKPPPRVDQIHVVAGMILIGCASLIPWVLKHCLPSPSTRAVATWVLGGAAAVGIFFWVNGLGDWARGHNSHVPLARLWNEGNREIDQLARDLRAGSPKSALVLIPPSAEMFKLRSRRSVVVEFKGFPLVDDGMLQWRSRMEDLLGTPLLPGMSIVGDLDALYEKRTDLELRKLANQYGAQYIVSQWHDRIDGCTLAHQRGDWRVFEVMPTSAAE